MAKLTAQQASFVEHYLSDQDVAQAAIRAGYSPQTAKVLGYKLLRKAQVQAAINAAKEAQRARSTIDADWVLARLAEQAEADIADLYDDNGDLLPVTDWPTVWRTGLVSDVEITALYEGRGDERKLIGHVKKLKLVDRTRRLEMIGKHVQVNAFQDIVKHKGLKALAERLERARRRALEAGA